MTVLEGCRHAKARRRVAVGRFDQYTVLSAGEHFNVCFHGGEYDLVVVCIALTLVFRRSRFFRVAYPRTDVESPLSHHDGW